jgi:hypothetical protein
MKKVKQILALTLAAILVLGMAIPNITAYGEYITQAENEQESYTGGQYTENEPPPVDEPPEVTEDGMGGG